MLYKKVRLEGVASVIPDQIVTSEEIERQLAPLYQRLRLPEGRLELMSGIRERRFFPAGMSPGDMSIVAARKALDQSGIASQHVGALIHGSVCRDHLEPATACRVHHALGLPSTCAAFDVSNACLGILTGATLIANMIELGQIRAGIVVGCECGRSLVENTIERLNQDLSITRESIKLSIASLTIGSAAAAMVLCDAGLSSTNNVVRTIVQHAASEHHGLCQSEGLNQIMATDSERLMLAGIEAGATTFVKLLHEWDCDSSAITKTVCHQVGSAHRKMMLEQLGINPARDFATLEWLGNTGSAALPASLAMAVEANWLAPGDRLGLLGIGSGVNCLMMGLEWQAPHS